MSTIKTFGAVDARSLEQLERCMDGGRRRRSASSAPTITRATASRSAAASPTRATSRRRASATTSAAATRPRGRS